MAPDVPTLDLAEIQVRDGLEELEEPCVVALRLWAGARALVDATAGSPRHQTRPRSRPLRGWHSKKCWLTAFRPALFPWLADRSMALAEMIGA